MENSESLAFRSGDLNLSAFLISKGVELLSAMPGAGKKIEYVFADAPKCEELVKEFCAGRAMVNARLFLEGLKRARDLRDALTMGFNHEAKYGQQTK